MELIGPIIEVFKCCGGPTRRYIDHHRKLEEHMNQLRRKVKDLDTRKQDLELKKDEALRRRLGVKNEVEQWFEDVQRVKSDLNMQEIEKKFEDVSYFLRGHLGKLIYRKIEEVNQIYEQGSFPDDVAVDGPPATGMTLLTPNLKGEVDVKEQIWEYLMGDEVGMTGVCGMGGIGKTTIMEHINNRLLKESKKFDHVIWVTVSKDLSIFKLQKVIADSLKQSLPEVELKQRAATLKPILEGKKYVLILDDVWEQFSLLDVGISELTLGVGRKVVLTSRSIDVCKSMGCKVVKVQPLSKDESMKLFLDHVGHTTLQEENLKDSVNNIVEQCGGLPLSIVTIAGSMKGVHDICEWRNALNEIKERVKSVRGSDNKIFECLKFSYDHLEDPKIQNCFLYCSLYPEDFVISKVELIESWIDEGLLEVLETRQAMHDRGYSILRKLENNCLLEKGTTLFDRENRVKMHDVLRDMALLYIKDHHSMVKAGMQLKEVPDEQAWPVEVEMVSLMRNQILEIPPQISPKCPHLSTLILRECGFSSIPESFFIHMPELKVLDVSRNQEIEDLPNSISNLKNLNALRLHGCRKLKCVPSLAKLRALRKLDLSGTAIEEVPQGIEKLENLKYLDLRSRELKEFPVGILPMIPHIQCLMLPDQVYVMGEEMGKLRKLEYARCLFGDMLELEKYAESVQGKWPTNFKFGVGSFEKHSDVQEDIVNFTNVEKVLCFPGCKMERCDDIMVPHDLHDLSIEDCDDLKCLTNLLLFRKATELKRCHIDGCSGIECAVDVSSSSCNALHTIEELRLWGLDNLQEIVRVRVGIELESTSRALSPLPVFFSSLRKLDLRYCNRLKKLFPAKLLQGLQNLEQIIIYNCSEVEEIIASEENHKGEGTTCILPKLKIIRLEMCPRVKKLFPVELLQGLQNLEDICVSSCSEMKEIIVSEESHKGEGTTFILPKLKKIRLSNCHRVKKLFPVELLQGLQNLEEIIVQQCEEMEEIIASEENHKGEGTTFILPKLKSLILWDLPKLKGICGGGVMIPADHLKKLVIFLCPEVKRMPLCLPLDENGQPSPPPSLKQIRVYPPEWWKSVEWDEPHAKHLLSPFVRNIGRR